MPGEDAVTAFMDTVAKTYAKGDATEHSYRPALKILIESIRLKDNRIATNEPKASVHGAVDYRISTTKTDLTVGHIETKNIDKGIRNFRDKQNKDQFERYKKAYPNLIYTNYCDWDFYRNGKLVDSVQIADYVMGIQPKLPQYRKLFEALSRFLEETPQEITSSAELAERMASRAQLANTILISALREDGERKAGRVYSVYRFDY